jgi:hypothetical protein
MSIIDVGCAIGDYVQGYLNLGIDAFGLEGSTCAERYLACPRDKIMFSDLRTPIKINKRYDVATCWEVAEHIDPWGVDNFVRNLCGFSDTVVMSAARPGHLGRHHINCQEHSFWNQKFGSLWYTRSIPIEDMIKRYLEPQKDKKDIRSYYQNLMVFKRR